MRSLFIAVGVGSMLGLLLAAYFVSNPLEAYYLSPIMALIFFISGFFAGIFVDGGEEAFAGFLTAAIIMLCSLLAAFRPGIATPQWITDDIRIIILSFTLPFLITIFGAILGNYTSYMVEGGGKR